MALTVGTRNGSRPNVVKTSDRARHGIQYAIPVIGDIHDKSPLAYRVTRAVVEVTNVAQSAFAEAYINGVEIPDSVMRALLNTCMPIVLKHFPALMSPYEWVLKETDQLAEGSKDLMKIQYDMPQSMLNRMLGDGNLIYPKYRKG